MVYSDVSDPDDPDFNVDLNASDGEDDSSPDEAYGADEQVDENGEKLESEDEEELMDRFDFEIEESVANWFDEFKIMRNCMPDDDSDDDEDPIVARDRKIRLGNSDKLAIGRSFFTMSEFKEAALHHALKNKQNLQQNRWEKKKVSYICGNGNCPWRVYCGWEEKKQLFLVKVACLEHRCMDRGRCKLLKSPVIGKLFMDKLRFKPNFWPLEIQAQIKEQWGLSSSIGQVQRGRLLGLKWIGDEYMKQFTHLRGYVEELKRSNPGTTAFVDTTPNAKRQDVFNRIYVCFGAMKHSFYFCRPLIGIDGTFLKHANRGCLLTAVAHDANNQIYPVAWAAVQTETADNWVWFLNQLKTDLDLKDGSKHVIISDRGKGILHVVPLVLPNAEHRFCVKHLVENLKKRHANKDLLKGLVWHLAWSYNMADYQIALNKIRAYSRPLYEDIMKENPKTWVRAFQRIGTNCEDVDNNFTESFNGTIVKARAKALVPMLETIRRQCMARIAKRKEKISKWTGNISEYAKDILDSEKEDAKLCHVTKGTHGKFEVSLPGNSHSLCLNENSWACSCGKWQISGIPCEHAYAAIMDIQKSVERFVSPYYLTLTWQEQYDTAPEPVRGQKFWMSNNYSLIAAPPRPKLPGREKGSKNKRIKGKLESPKKKKKKFGETEVEVEVLRVSRKGRVMHCSQCGEEGHNSATCKKFPKEKDSQESNRELHEYLLSLQAQVVSSQVASSEAPASSSQAPSQAPASSSQAPSSSQEPTSSQADPQITQPSSSQVPASSQD